MDKYKEELDKVEGRDEFRAKSMQKIKDSIDKKKKIDMYYKTPNTFFNRDKDTDNNNKSFRIKGGVSSDRVIPKRTRTVSISKKRRTPDITSLNEIVETYIPSNRNTNGTSNNMLKTFTAFPLRKKSVNFTLETGNSYAANNRPKTMTNFNQRKKSIKYNNFVPCTKELSKNIFSKLNNSNLDKHMKNIYMNKYNAIMN